MISYKSLFMTLSVCTSCACTTVHIHHAQLEIKHEFGIANIHVSPNADGVAYVSTEGLGLVAAGRFWSLGYAKETVFQVAEHSACKAIIFSRTQEDYEAIQKLIKSSKNNFNNICLYKDGEQS